MSWWWLAPLLVALVGAALVGDLTRRCRAEARHAAVATEGLRSTLVDLAEARRDLVVDMARYAPDHQLVAGAAETGPAHQ